ncbi:MAG: phage portal protein [Thermomicrobiales bacterium]|nr:phage portal protein [Thermomicrobiales bacterium]
MIVPQNATPSATHTTLPLQDEDRVRLRRYDELSSFYEGAQWTSRPLPGEFRLTVNYARALIRKVAAYVFPAPVTFAVPASGDQQQATRAESVLQEIIVRRSLSQLDAELAVESAVIGDAAVKITWRADERRPIVAPVHPGTLSVLTSVGQPRDITAVWQRYAMTGAELNEVIGGELWIDPVRRYQIVEQWTADRWTLTVDGQLVHDDANPYGWIPYVILANNPRPLSFWGESDLVDLIDVCRELNARMSVLASVLQLSGAPIAVLENVDGAEGIRVGPGARWELPRDSKAYLLDLLGSGGVSLHVDYINLLYRALHDLSETPRTAFGDSGRTISGAALEVEVQPLIQKVARKRQQWNAFYQQRNARLLDLFETFGEYDLGGLRQTEALWPPVLPSDRDAAVRNAVALVDAGIQSRYSAIASLGGTDPGGELSRIDSERESST